MGVGIVTIVVVVVVQATGGVSIVEAAGIVIMVETASVGIVIVVIISVTRVISATTAVFATEEVHVGQRARAVMLGQRTNAKVRTVTKPSATQETDSEHKQRGLAFLNQIQRLQVITCTNISSRKCSAAAASHQTRSVFGQVHISKFPCRVSD